MRLALLPCILLVGLVAGCAIHPVPTTVDVTGMPNPEEALRRSMQHVDDEMAQLGQLTPSPVSVDQPVMPEDLQRIVSFKWTGSLDDGVAKLAQSIGYTFYTTAPANSKPVAVTVEVSSVPAFRVFQTLGEEAGSQATVQVDALHHQVEVIHHV